MGILLAVLVIFLGVRPLFTQTITNDSIASAIILVLIGIAYIVIVAKPQWAKAVFFFEGIIIGISGYTLLATPYNYWSCYCCNSCIGISAKITYEYFKIFL